MHSFRGRVVQEVERHAVAPDGGATAFCPRLSASEISELMTPMIFRLNELIYPESDIYSPEIYSYERYFRRL